MELFEFIKKFMLLVNEEKQEFVIPVNYENEKYYFWIFRQDDLLVGSLETKTKFKNLGEVISIIHETLDENGNLTKFKIGFIDQELEFDVINED